MLGVVSLKSTHPWDFPFEMKIKASSVVTAHGLRPGRAPHIHALQTSVSRLERQWRRLAGREGGGYLAVVQW